MKLLVFAHVPPPHHGQSYLVQKMIEGFGGDVVTGAHRIGTGENPHGIECYHVDVRLKDDVEDTGKASPRKVWLLVKFCLQAIRYRFQYGVKNFYFPPACALKNTLRRDWVVLGLCRLFFKNIIFHWHASGLMTWVEEDTDFTTRLLTRLLLGRPELSISLSRWGQQDALRLKPKRDITVPNGIPDPCPDFDSAIRPLRLEQLRRRTKLLTEPADAAQTPENGRINVLFMGLGMEEKGLIDAIRGVCLANRRMREKNVAARYFLRIAGKFLNAAEQALYERTLDELKMRDHVEHLGFLGGEQKRKVLTETDIFCFPTFFFAESFAIVIVEAMAFGIPVVTTRWRSLPGLFDEGYDGLADPKAPEQVADALVRMTAADCSAGLRARFLANYTLDRHLRLLAEAIRSVERPAVDRG